ncbi:uncharacterized protein LOC128873142 [Hylaeus volcanicus]|uniref:uncharacterized protein LOC128873142 n=1 Tax=Hylaeus volcanicus TaxID=313075 RepID=UPI0023B7D0B9|nr:uncharacterized protein LOC128873142 [Hylaeus volcanicus]
MNSLFVISCILLAASMVRADIVDAYLEKYREQFVTCAKENGLTEQNPRDAFDNDAKAGLEGASCLRACTLKAMGALKDSKLDLVPAIQFIETIFPEDPQMVQGSKKVLEECAEKVKGTSDECKMAYSFIECFLDKQ